MTSQSAHSTSIDLDDYFNLIPVFVQNRADLNRVEFQSLLRFKIMGRWHHLRTEDLLDDLIARRIHRSMFADVWLWAGEYRRRESNIGVSPENIAIEMLNLLHNAKIWFGSQDEIKIIQDACLLHHALVKIHPFVNGNGRFAREYVNAVLRSLGMPAFTWGSTFYSIAESREHYIGAIRAADKGDFGPLVDFCYL